MFTRLISEALTFEGQWLVLFFLLQGVLISYDEIILHRAREMTQWERLGHPVDTFFFFLPFFLAGFFPELISNQVFIFLSVLSSIIILKDEWVHVGRINVKESFVHAALFVLHPVILYWGFENYKNNHYLLMQNISITLIVVCLIQIVYWNFINKLNAQLTPKDIHGRTS